MSGMADLRVRVLSAAIAMPFIAGAIWAGGWPFVAMSALATVVVIAELSAISRDRHFDAGVLIGAVGLVAAMAAIHLAQYGLAVILLLATVIAAQLFAWSNDRARLFAVTLVYLGLAGFSAILLRDDPNYGLRAAAWLLLIVMATDTGAYFIGRAFRGPKLAPAISPAKTWSGAIGGVVAAVSMSALFTGLFLNSPMSPMIGLAVIVSVIAQCGDLAESRFKRRFGVKDASGLIPGHGGLLDRIDSLFAACIIAGLIGIARGGLTSTGQGLLLW